MMPILERNRFTLSIYWGLRVLLAGAVIAYGVRAEWDSAGATLLILALMAVPSILKERYRMYLPFQIDLGLTVFVFLTLFLGAMANFYRTIPLWDKFLHFQSGLLLGATGFVSIYLLNERESRSGKLSLSPGFISLFAVVFSLSIGAMWEMAEFASDAALHGHWQASNADTMWDLIADLSGALMVSVLGYFWMYRHNRLPLTPWALRLFKRRKNN